MFLKEARTQCLPEAAAFAECSVKYGILGIFKCKTENKHQNICTSSWATQERWDEYRNKKLDELIANGTIFPFKRKPCKLR